MGVQLPEPDVGIQAVECGQAVALQPQHLQVDQALKASQPFNPTAAQVQLCALCLWGHVEVYYHMFMCAQQVRAGWVEGARSGARAGACMRMLAPGARHAHMSLHASMLLGGGGHSAAPALTPDGLRILAATYELSQGLRHHTHGDAMPEAVLLERVPLESPAVG